MIHSVSCIYISLGNTVVCKPSEMTSVTAWMLCKLMQEAGLPDGVVNMVYGLGGTAGEALINHQDVNVFILFHNHCRLLIHFFNCC